MKKSSFIVVASVVAVSLILIGLLGYVGIGNKQLFDGHQRFEYAYVCWPDGTAEKLELRSWKDYDGEQIQITTDRGTFLFNSNNCVLAHE